MKQCENQHTPVIFEGFKCPVCMYRENQIYYLNEMTLLRDSVSYWKSEAGRLQKIVDRIPSG